MGALDRRALFYENDAEYDPNIVFDINEYLITNWPKLSLKNRKSIWTICQNNDDFDLSSLEEQVDIAVVEFAASDPVLSSDPDFHESVLDSDEEEEYEEDYEEEEYEEEDYEEEEDEEEYDYSNSMIIDVYEYLRYAWPTLTDDQCQYFADVVNSDEEFNYDPLYNEIDSYVYTAAEEDDSIILPEEEEEDTSEE